MFQPCLQKTGSRSKQVKCSNPAYPTQEADAKQQEHLDPHQRQKEASTKHSNLACRKQEAEVKKG